jgi:hypothetical protein
MTPNAISGDSVSKKDDGGPAFPLPIATAQDGSIYNVGQQSGGEFIGVSVRDYFAAKAMQALMHPDLCKEALCDFGNDVDSMLKHLAVSAYRHADAMLAARSKP